MTPPTSTRKQREIEEREGLILDVAREMLLERGYLGLTMDRIAATTEYSKGTIYQHFKNKEDLLAALAAQTMRARIGMFERAATFAGKSRERYAAIGIAEELFVQLNPSHFRSQHIIFGSSFQAKANQETLSELLGCENHCASISSGIIRDAIAHGDLELPDGMVADELGVNLWALYLGTFTILHSGIPLDQFGVRNPIENLRRAGQKLLDGFHWTPVSTEWDYDQTNQRILEEVFPSEFELLNKQQAAK